MLIEKWIGYEFESSSGLTQEFADFTKDFKKAITSQLPEGYKLVSSNRGHFYISGFVKSPANKYVYFSTSDVRHFKDEWYNNILIRTAKGDKDFTGGVNRYTSFKDFKINVTELLEKGA